MSRRCARWSARPSVTSAPPVPPADPSVDPALAALRRVVDKLAASTYAIGELMLEAAPAYLSDTETADVLATASLASRGTGRQGKPGHPGKDGFRADSVQPDFNLITYGLQGSWRHCRSWMVKIWRAR